MVTSAMLAAIFTALRSLIFASSFVVLWTWVALTLDRRFPAPVDLPRWLKIPGALLIVGGGVLALSCIALFVVKGKGTPAPFDAPRQFVAVGPYRYVRNPMYLGAFAVILGFGLWMNSATILIFGLPWLLLAHFFVLVYEEPVLREKFGDSYKNYCATVRRWIPKKPKL
jgi:protein-S-isoprenylcysteine O-methyltransferase Ste14